MPESSHDSGLEVAKLRELFRLTGALHEVQRHNLQIWPRLAFPGASDCVVAVDTESRCISFRLVFTWWRRLPADADKRCRGLAKSVQYLLGQDFEVLVSSGGKLIFTADRIDSVDAQVFTGTDYEAGRVVPKTPWNFKKKS